MLPSDMIEDQPVHMDRVCAIEATMDEMKSQHEATHQLLQDVLIGNSGEARQLVG